MRVMRCDGCGKDILPPKRVFALVTYDDHRGGISILQGDLCVDCHSKVRDILKAQVKK